MQSVDIKYITNLPDLSFVQYCIQKYGINRGVFNTIDSWFFEDGLLDIKDRRQTILLFLQYVSFSKEKNDKIKFGNGGLTLKLVEFKQNRSLEKEVV
ncbi:hypothetical protein [Bacillus timonensis]|uniref:hypothetical protein n=1 Tax=Bacillus timonensis TaxID=1033734 RepID=UPI000288531C|nr:hypothetical protein [Bacillus timonensis]